MQPDITNKSHNQLAAQVFFNFPIPAATENEMQLYPNLTFPSGVHKVPTNHIIQEHTAMHKALRTSVSINL